MPTRSTPAHAPLGPDRARASKVRTVARKAAGAGRVAGKAGVKLAEPVVGALRQEEPKTLAKMALAAIAPKLVEGAVRFAIRNPGVTAITAMTVAGMLLIQSPSSPAED